ncbi:uncharacterized [Tachysurus ichikawai]
MLAPRSHDEYISGHVAATCRSESSCQRCGFLLKGFCRNIYRYAVLGKTASCLKEDPELKRNQPSFPFSLCAMGGA